MIKELLKKILITYVLFFVNVMAENTSQTDEQKWEKRKAHYKENYQKKVRLQDFCKNKHEQEIQKSTSELLEQKKKKISEYREESTKILKNNIEYQKNKKQIEAMQVKENSGEKLSPELRSKIFANYKKEREILKSKKLVEKLDALKEIDSKIQNKIDEIYKKDKSCSNIVITRTVN